LLCLVPLQVADLNALAELGKVYQDSLALSAQLRNLSSFRLQQDKVLGRGSLAVVQEGQQGPASNTQLVAINYLIEIMNYFWVAGWGSRSHCLEG
jgi:hypothetical protein